MAKAKYVSTGRTNDNMDMNLQQNTVDLSQSVNELIDPDLLLRSFGISDEFVDHMADLCGQNDSSPKQQGVIIKNNQMSSPNSGFSSVNQLSQNSFQLTSLQNMLTPQQSFSFSNQPPASFPPSSSGSTFIISSPVTLQQRAEGGHTQGQPDTHVTLPLETLQNLLSQQNISYGQAEHEVSNHLVQTICTLSILYSL